jgi:penicillin-binding protein 2
MSLKLNETVVEKSINKRIRIIIFFITLLFVFVFSRLWYLQILKGEKFNELSINNRIRITKIPDFRGRILSKDGEVLVKNIPSFDLSLIPQDTPDIKKVLKKVSELLDLDLKILLEKHAKKKNRPPFEPILLKEELAWNEMSLVLSKKTTLPGININVVPKRFYCVGNFAPHVFGFLGKANYKELEEYGSEKYLLGDMVGKYGLEKWGEKYLKGKPGGLQTEVDVFGNRKKILAEISPVNGKDIIISINPFLQKKAEDLLRDKVGSVVAMDPDSGEILVLASSPGFNPNLFARGIEQKKWGALTDNPFHPMMNRALQSQQPPGSVFKPITAIAALEEKTVDPHKTIFCSGSYTLGNRSFSCWKKNGHGWVDMKKAIVQSCDCYFYTLGLSVGIDKISKYAKMFGLGEKTGVVYDNEKSGLVPSSGWKIKKYGKPWQKGETLNTSIGQGFLLTTPIQIAAAYCGIANGKNIPVPRIVLEIKENGQNKIFKKETGHRLNLSAKNLSYIRDALVASVNEPEGTGGLARVEGVIVAGKTGTAQVVSKKGIVDENKIPYRLRDHAWFVAFAPVKNPEIVVCVLIENGGHGGSAAAPVAKEIISKYIKR